MTTRTPLDSTLPSSFAVHRALELGHTRDRLRASDLHAPFHGARMPAAEVSPLVRSAGYRDRSRLDPHRWIDSVELRHLCRAYLAIAPRGVRFSHITAARLWGMPVPARLETAELHVVVAPWQQPPRRRGVIGHRSADPGIAVVDGLPAVMPPAAWMTLAVSLSADELVMAGDFLVRRKKPFTTIGQLADLVGRNVGARGIAASRKALADIRSGTDSPPETMTRLLLTRAGLAEPRVGHTVRNRGVFVGTPDLAYPDHRIAIEYEGADHRLDPQTYENDIDRRGRFERAGWKVILVTARKLRQRSDLIAEVREALLRAEASH